MEYDRHGFVNAEDGTQLWYGLRGPDGEGVGLPIVLNDGIGCDGFVWRYLQPALSRERRVLHWHYRGHGRSGAPADPARVDVGALARDMGRVLDGVGIDRAVVIGHSMGTQVALEWAQHAPDRAAALVLLCGTYGKITHTFHGTDVLKDILPRVIETVQKKRGLARALWGSVPPGVAFRVARISGEVDALSIREEDFRPYWEHIRWMDPNVFLAMLRAAGEHSAEDVLPRLRCPVLVFAAEKDTFVPAAVAEHMAEHIPGAELEVIEGGSHAAPVEQPDVVIDRVKRFLAERVDSPQRPTRRPSARADR